ARAKLEGIFNPDDKPTVTVAVLSAQHRTFNVAGAIANPALYPIVRPDFRLREAIHLAGGLDPTVKDIYVFRNSPRKKLVRERRAVPPAPAGPAVLPELDLPPAPPVSPSSMSEPNMSRAGGPAPAML